MPGEEERMGLSNNHFDISKKMENWEEHILNNNNNNNNPSSSSSSRASPAPPPPSVVVDVIKQESGSNMYGHGHHGSDEEFQASGSYWLNNNMTMIPPSLIPSKSRTSNTLDFTYDKPLHNNNQLQHSPSQQVFIILL